MYKNVHIIGVGTYNPEKVIDNEHYIKHFKELGKQDHAKALMEKLSRKTRNIATKDETSVSMEVEASKNALKKAQIDVDDIDMIISASDTPEYLTPSCALLIKNNLKANNVTNVFDVNCDCIGMLTAMDIASRYLKTDKKYKKVLISGSLLISPFANKEDPIVYSCLADGAAAVVLELRNEDEKRGLLGSKMYTDDEYNHTIRFPKCGLSNITDDTTKRIDMKMQWNPFDFSFLSDRWTSLIKDLVKECEYSIEDVDHYFMSQFSKPDIKSTMRKLKTDMKKVTYVGDKFGYTGCPSPIMALKERMNSIESREDKLGVFCSVAGGYTMGALLYKW
ncbi:MAG: ketoacyl-ACP synthase III [Firmicutes bacterium]|nr:ketoacyl-ACP synthase III [Bacillota bacterium]